LFVYRDDLNHPLMQGNKFRKLSGALARIKKSGVPGVISFGGAFSNHLFALAAAGHAMQIPTVGIVRGTWADLNNDTLKAVQSYGMQLHRVSPTAYEAGTQHPELETILQAYPSYEVIPEGGTTSEGIYGCVSLGVEIKQWAETVQKGSRVHVFVSMGSGGTATGMIHGLAGAAHTHLVAPTEREISRERIFHLQDLAQIGHNDHFTVYLEYIEGGYGRRTPIINGFINQFKQETGVLCDPVYTCKTFYAAQEMIKKGMFKATDTILLVHTGGLQGWNSTNKHVLEATSNKKDLGSHSLT
jgi:1-aminocyclopropane-1-carboxylate deaminase